MINTPTLHKFVSFHRAQKTAKNLDYFLAILKMLRCNLKTYNILQAKIKIFKKKISPDFQTKKLKDN